MKPTEILSSEHRVIEIGLNCLDRLADQTNRENSLDTESAKKLVDFIRNFADRCHHGKEENQLFVRLHDKGMPQEGGPTGQMIHEHEQGRGYVQGMADSIDEVASGNNEAISKFVENARSYVLLLRLHIQKEDNILFPMADRVLDNSDQDFLLAEFGKVEEEHMGHGTHDKYVKLIGELADRFGVAKDALHGHSCGCSH